MTDGRRRECNCVQDIQDARHASLFCPECARIQDIRDRYLVSESPERTCTQGEIRTRRGRPEHPECARIRNAARSASSFRPECACVQDIQGAYFRPERPVPKSGRGAGVLNITNARAFRAPDPCPDFVPNTRAFRISTILFRVQNVLNGRAFGAKSGRGAGFLNILHASAFGIFRTSNPRPDFALTARAFVIFRTS